MEDHILVSSPCDALKETEQKKKELEVSVSFFLRVSPEQLLSIQSFSNINGVYVGLPLNSLMASKELLQHSIWPSVYKCVWSSSEEGNDFVYSWGKEHHQQKKKSPTERWRHLYWSVSLYKQYFFLSSAQKEKWLGGKTGSRERGLSCNGVLFISSLAPQWLVQWCQSAQSGSHISCTHKPLFYLSGCYLLSIWLSSLCLSTT